jgi:hypothetical protein
MKFKLFCILCIAIITALPHSSKAQSKFKYDTDKLKTLYTLLEQTANAAKLYAYKDCFTMNGDSITAVNEKAVSEYLAYLKSIDLFSDEYLSREKKWFESIKKQLAKTGHTDEMIEDKFYGSSNPQAVKEELLLRKNAPGYHFGSYWGSVQRGGHGVFKSTFQKAGYDMKVSLTHIGEDWYIDWIKQGKDRN